MKEADPGQQEAFENLKQVHDWLTEQGWKLSLSGIYKHRREGKIGPDMPDGSFSRKRVEKYAKDWLKRADTGMRPADEIETLQQRKLREEIRRINAQTRKAEHDLAVSQGKYIPRSDFFAELAARALALESGLKAMVQQRALAWIELVNGQETRASELVAAMAVDIDRLLGEFASLDHFVVMLDVPSDLCARRDVSQTAASDDAVGNDDYQAHEDGGPAA